MATVVSLKPALTLERTMTDTEQIAHWKTILLKAKKWGNPVPWPELQAAVDMIERHPYGLPDCSDKGPLREWQTPAAEFNNEEAPTVRVTTEMGHVSAALLEPPHAAQQEPKDTPSGRKKRQDRAGAYNAFVKQCKAEGMGLHEIHERWRQQKDAT